MAYAQIDPATPDSLYRISADPLLNGGGDIVRVGNDVYLANAAHNVVLKIDGATGVTSVFAGAADKPSGFANGVGPDARFSFPSCITADGEGNLYEGDMGNYLVRKITTAATVITPAAEVTVLKAYDTPTEVHGITIGNDGNLYVAKTTLFSIHNGIDRITPEGGATPIYTEFLDPHGIAIDSMGNFYVLQSMNINSELSHFIFKLSPQAGGTYAASILAGGPVGYVDGAGDEARFNDPNGISIDAADNLYVADTGNSAIRKISTGDSSATVSTVVGTPGDHTLGLGLLPGSVPPPIGVGILSNNPLQLAITTGSSGVLGVNLFNEFSQPDDNAHGRKTLEAGRAVPVKSGLEGNHGSNVFAPAYPQSQAIDCDTSVPSDAAEPIVPAGSESSRRHAKDGQYSFVWKTDKAWAGQCRQLVIKFIDGNSHTSVFKFTE